MLITNKNELKKFTSPHRIWQGIPGIEVTCGGRIFMTFYSGGTREEIGNYACLIQSDDGIVFSEPIAVALREGDRCFDPCLWIDPLGRLWWTWAVAPTEHAVYATICDDPDAEELVFCEPFIIGREVMMNKPTVLSTGEWLFPIAVWSGVTVIGHMYDSDETERLAFVYRSADNGKSFVRLGGSDIPKRSFDEHMILERRDGSLAMYVRANYGIGVSYSYDRGKTWTEGKNSGLGGPSSRFYIGRLRSGRVLLINHTNFKGRNNLTALLSEDDGRTWKYRLMLDERNNVSYPDVKEAEDGYIYVAYDRERGCFRRTLSQACADAREILFAKITEEDIMAGQVVSEGSRLCCVASKLGWYADEGDNPFGEIDRYSENDLVKLLLSKDSTEIPALLFDQYDINCRNMHKLDREQLDDLIGSLEAKTADKESIIRRLVTLIRSVSVENAGCPPVVVSIKNAVRDHLSEDPSTADIAEAVCISRYYMCHLFKKETGITVVDYKNELKLTRSKEMLICTDDKIADIAYACGFGSASYFSKIFSETEHISPSQYRSLHKK